MRRVRGRAGKQPVWRRGAISHPAARLPSAANSRQAATEQAAGRPEQSRQRFPGEPKEEEEEEAKPGGVRSPHPIIPPQPSQQILMLVEVGRVAWNA